jgi:hypothetical protein
LWLWNQAKKIIADGNYFLAYNSGWSHKRECEAFSFVRFCFYAPLSRWAARGIAAESPQEAHRRFRGLAAESPVFLPGCGQKNAPKKQSLFSGIPVAE